PQLLNVLRGDMSFVGPRPEVPRYVDAYTAEQRRVLEVVPGITDPASLWSWNEAEILARSSNPEQTYLTEVLPSKVRLQLAYAASATLGRDIKLIFATLRNMGVRLVTQVLHRLVPYRRPFIIAVHCLLIVLAYQLAYEL